MTSRLTPFVTAWEGWFRARRPSELVSEEELREHLRELRADDAFWERQRPRFETGWDRVERRLREEQRPLRALLSPETTQRLVEGVEALEPDPDAVRTFLRSPAIESMLGEILYNGISEFLKRVDLLGNIVDKLPVLGGIRRRVMAAFKEEVEGRLETQIKGFLGSFSGRAVDRMIQYVLSEEHRAGFREARRRVAEHLLDRPLQSLLPDAATSARWKEAAWKALRQEQASEAEHLSRFYEDMDEPLDGWLWESSPGLRELVARQLERFLESEEAAGWTLSADEA